VGSLDQPNRTRKNVRDRKLHQKGGAKGK